MKLGLTISQVFSVLSLITTALSAFSEDLLPSWSYTTPALMTISAVFLLVAGVAFMFYYTGVKKP